MSSSFTHFFYAFVPEGDDQSIANYVRSMSMGLRWERATDVTPADRDRIASDLKEAAHRAHTRSLEYRSQDSRQFGRDVARSLAARTRDPARTVLIRICSGA